MPKTAYRAVARPGPLWIALPTVALLLLGCQEPPKPVGLPRLFAQEPTTSSAPNEVDPNSKYATYEQELAGLLGEMPQMDHKDYAMLAANRAMILDALGRTDEASKSALDAQAIMTGQVKGEEQKAAAAAASDESLKVFKGECYEIAMLNCFVGICSLKDGDNETASIGFRRALEADKMSKEGCRDDFKLAYWGLGMATVDSEPDTAGQMFKRCGYKSADQVAGDNMVFLIYMGRAPCKRLTGAYGEHDMICRCQYEPAYAKVFADGASLGKSIELIDLHSQSRGVPKTKKDTGQAAKGIGKLVLASTVGAFLGGSAQDLVEAAWVVKADTRACYMLPNEVHVVGAAVPPGSHTVKVKFYGRGGAELNRYEQVWRNVRAPARGRRFVTIRSEFDRCNVQGPVAFTRISKVDCKALPAEKPTGQDKPAQAGELVSVAFRAANLPELAVGDTVKLCHFYARTQCRMDTNYHWRYQPMAYNNQGQPVGHPNCKLRMQDYDVGLVGLAKVSEINGETAKAEVVSLTTDYKPQVDDMVTKATRVGRLWR